MIWDMEWWSQKRPMILGHRGASADALENTEQAFRLAIDSGADGVELDVRPCKTGELIVHHDASLERIYGVKKDIADMTLCDIQTVRHAGAPSVLSLAIALEILADAIVNIELKPCPFPSVVQTLVDTILRSPCEKMWISCFDWQLLAEVGFTTEDVLLGALYDVPQDKALLDLQRSFGPRLFRHPSYDLLEQEQQGAADSLPSFPLSLPCVVWTVDDLASVMDCVHRGVRGIITNTPGTVSDWVASNTSP